MSNKKHVILSILLFCTLIIATYTLYLPGLSGTFLLDDYANLNRLETSQPTYSLEHLKDYLNVGRPLAYASFLLNDISWPSQAESFLHTNILLHILCGAVLIGLSYKVARILLSKPKQAESVALMAGCLWLIHPLWVSTTLYVVQRMTILAAIFTAISLICYLLGRQKIVESPRIGYAYLYLGIPFFAFLGFLSKENAVLIPIYLLLFERILFSSKPSSEPSAVKEPSAVTSNEPAKDLKPKGLKIWQYLYVYIPSCIVIAILLFYMPFIKSFALRDFSLTERLLSESRILFEYLYYIAIPQPITPGLHYENYPISQSLLTPISTLFSILGILTLIILAGLVRHKHPILTLAIGFFFIAHLVESSTIPLELYFEHRNYLPAFFLIFALAYYINQLAINRQKLAIAIFSILVSLLAINTYAYTNLWGQPLKLLLNWTELNPHSKRNYQEGINLALKQRQVTVANYLLTKGRLALPHDTSLMVFEIIQSCYQPKQREQLLNEFRQELTKTNEFKRRYLYLDLTRLIEHQVCSTIEKQELYRLLDAALLNPIVQNNKERQQELSYLRGILSYQEGSYDLALEHFNHSIHLKVRYSYVIKQALLLADKKQYSLALKHIQQAKKQSDSSDTLGNSILALQYQQLLETEQQIRNLQQ